MKKLIALLTIVSLVFACSTIEIKSKSTIINNDNLPNQSFSLNINKDTVITTKAGIVIDYKANSIEAETPTVQLEIKEALDLQDILKAGLTTQTKDGILSSDGMFKISTKEKSTIKKALKIKVPTNAFDNNMQLFKGVEQDGKIVWENPKPILKDSTKPNGKELYMKNCASCHAIGKNATGPDLAWVEERWNKRSNLIEYIKNNRKFMFGENRANALPASVKLDTTSDIGFEKSATVKENVNLVSNKNYTNQTQDSVNSNNSSWYSDGTYSNYDFYIEESVGVKVKNQKVSRDVKYSKFLFCQYNFQQMTAFESILSNIEIEEILKYIKTESNLRAKPNLPFYYDSCLQIEVKYKKLLKEKVRLQREKEKLERERIRLATEKENAKQRSSAIVQYNPSIQSNSINNNSTSPIVNVPPSTQKEPIKGIAVDVYTINIETYGWYNIDKFLNDANAVDALLNVFINDAHQNRMNVYFIVPQSKVFIEAQPTSNDRNKFCFHGNDGKTKLPLGLQAYIFAVGEEKEKVFYSIQPFIITQQNEITLKIDEITKDDLYKKLAELQLQDFKINIEKVKNYDEVKAIDSTVNIVELETKKVDSVIKDTEIKGKGCECLYEEKEIVAYK